MTDQQQNLEQRVAALEAQAGVQGVQAGGAGQAGAGAAGGEGEAAMMQAFLQGAYAATALAQTAESPAQGVGAEGGTMGFLGGRRWNPTKYDSFFWCKSRFMCNPQSVSCLC